MSVRLRSLLGTVRRFLVERLPVPLPSSTSRPSVGTGRLSGGSLLARVLSAGHVTLAWLFESLEQPDRALPHAVRSAALDPGSGRALTRAVRLALATGPAGVVRVANVGLADGRLGDASLARDLTVHARERGASANSTRVQLVRAALSVGDLAEAESLLAACDGGDDVDRVSAEFLQLAGRTRGGLLVREAAELVELWERILTAAPADGVIRDRLVRHLVWMGEYHHARRLAWPGGDDGAAAHDDVDADAAPNGWLFVAHAEALAHGGADRAHAIKLQIARRLVAEVPAPTAPCWRFIEAMRALSYLGEASHAHRHLDERLGHRLRHVDELAIRKLAADLRLADGDVEPIIAVRSSLATPTPTAERRFADAVAGARVLVVGPAPSTQPTSADIESADVVVFTKRPRETAGDRQFTVIYPSDSSVLLEDSATVSADAGIDLVVLRPSIVGIPGRAIDQAGDVRVMPCEDSNALLGTRLGVQRIVYDILAYRPGELVLSGIDFFLGHQAYVDGYANEVSDIYEPNGLQPARSFAPHDHLWDYRFVRELHRGGTIHATDGVAELLDLDDSEYLARLTERLSAAVES